MWKKCFVYCCVLVSKNQLELKKKKISEETWNILIIKNSSKPYTKNETILISATITWKQEKTE